MTLLAPMAAITDLLLSLTAFAMTLGCLRHYQRTGSRRTRWWSLGLATLGLGALMGFVNLGFETGLERPIFLVQRFSIGIAVFAMISSATESLVGSGSALQRWHRLYQSLLIAYYLATLFNSSFVIFLLYSGGALVATLVLELYRWRTRQESGAAWLASGILISIIAAVLQAAQLSFTLVWHFDHNAIYHMVQLFALLFLYKGATAPQSEKEVSQWHSLQST